MRIRHFTYVAIKNRAAHPDPDEIRPRRKKFSRTLFFEFSAVFFGVRNPFSLFQKMFSRSRFPADLSPNRWTRILRETRERARVSGELILDLAVSNPTAVGFLWKRDELARALASGAIEAYSPSPRGNADARRAVADFYRETHGAEISPDAVHLTASTSEAYSWLAKLLCESGDNVITPAPSYPLIAHLCGMDGVRTRDYFLNFDEAENRWATDFPSLENAIDSRTRAIFCVAPNNPTGSVFSDDEREKLLTLARERNLPLVVDEVFLEYANGNCSEYPPLRSFAGTADAPVFVLGGLSKSAALPQIKVGWILTCGPEEFVEQTLPRLDFIADTYLSSSAPAQCAVPALLAASGSMRERICARLNENERLLHAWAKTSPHELSVLPRTAGWYAVVRLPKGVSEEALSVDLLRRENVIAHPGYFYDVESVPAPHLVLSLITPPEILAAALPRIDSALLRN